MTAVLSDWAAGGGIATALFAATAVPALLVDHHGKAAARSVRAGVRYVVIGGVCWLALTVGPVGGGLDG
jgi:hypothetical protein